MTSVTDIAVGFLAGGQARRMGGQDKPFITVGGQTILNRQMAVTAQHQIRLINANGDLTRFSGYGLPVVPDSIAGWGLPAGILACLDWLAETHPACDLMLSCATDAPLSCLIWPNGAGGTHRTRRCSGSGPLIWPASSCVWLWPVTIRTDLRAALLEDGIRKIDDFTDQHLVAIADFDGTPDPFSNEPAG